MTKNQQIHLNKLFKNALEFPLVISELVQLHLPEHIQNNIDMESFKIEDKFCTEEPGDNSFCNVLFSAKTKNSEDFFINVILTKLSGIALSLKLMKFKLDIYEMYLAQDNGSKKLPQVFDCIYYSGEEEPENPLSFSDLLKHVKYTN